MELRHLRYFVAAAEELHFGRAAERSCVAPPTLSQQIKTFEGEIGAQLFVRSRRGVTLTDVGTVLLPHARRLLADAAHTEAAVRAAADGRAGELRIGYEAPVIRDGLAAVVRAFRTDAPDATLDFWEAGSREQADAVRRGTADVGLVFLPVNEDGLSVQVLAVEPVLVVVPDTHAFAGRATISAADLCGEPMIVWGRDLAPEMYDASLRAFHAGGGTLNVVQEVRHAESLFALVAAGVGLGTIHAARMQPAYPGVAYARLVEPDLLIETGIVWRRGNASPLLARFLDAVTARMA